ncbi:hypothetical protein OBK23_01995 [Empedobacter falsenii]|uniref:hypothetical protein n=1 Tax=Empedobacter falsenii TaxID=343874 RepID=UPI003A807A24
MKKILLLILLLSVSFITSCSQDDMTTEISNNKKYAKETISFKEFLNIEKNNFEVQKLNKYLPEKLKKTNYLNDIDWEIDTTKVIKITTENIITYTFSVNEKSQIEGFRNIIVKKENNQTTNYIVHYPYGVDFEGKSSRQVFINKIESNLFSKKNECYVVVLVPVYGCSTGECVVGEWYLKDVECKTDNDGDNNGGGNPPVNNGSEWDPEDGISLPTDPIGGGGNGSSAYSLNTIHISSYIYLSDFEKQWLTDNPIITDLFLQLLQITNYSDQSKNQISWAKSYLSGNTSATDYFNKNPQDLDILFALGTDFFNQNPNVNWDYLENWFFNGNNLNPSVRNEYLQDLKNPVIVKPTKRFKNNTKINGIYNQAKTASNFKQYLKNFEPTFSVAHLLFDIGETTQGNYAVTSVPKDYWIKITFNQNVDWNNTPKIIIADTFMHEMIHAEIFRKLLSIGSTNGNIDINKITQYLNTHNYPGLFDYYVERTVGGENWQHETMGAHYVNIMVNFLKQLYNNKYTDVEYKTIVWMGLKGTIAWNSLSQTERTLYETTWNEKYWTWEL